MLGYEAESNKAKENALRIHPKMEVHHGALGMRLHCICTTIQNGRILIFRHFTTTKKPNHCQKA